MKEDDLKLKIQKLNAFINKYENIIKRKKRTIECLEQTIDIQIEHTNNIIKNHNESKDDKIGIKNTSIVFNIIFLIYIILTSIYCKG